MQKHAYLIIAHNNWKILERLLFLLDDPRNDIYLHVDRKSRLTDFADKVCFASLSVFHEIDVRWGDVSQIQVEFFLFKAAYSKGKYTYYHLISGCDLPIKTQDEIHAFFNRHYPAEFIGFTTGTIEDRVDKIHVFSKHYRMRNKGLGKILGLLRGFAVFLQGILDYHHYKLDDKLMKGPNWVSITEQAVSLILSQEEVVMKQYRYSFCADEIYKQTILGNSFLSDRVYDRTDDNCGCMRCIDWKRGNPYVFHSADFEQLMHSDRMFARKFDEEIDFDIVEKIVDTLKGKQK